MAHEWFIVRNGKETGPYNPVELKQMAATGRLQPNDLVRRGDLKAASKASTIKGLFTPVEAVPTKPSSPPTSTEAAPPATTQKNSVPAKKTLITLSVVGRIGVSSFFRENWCQFIFSRRPREKMN